MESPRAKLQRVSSEDCRTPVPGQTVKQCSEMRSALEFFATAQSTLLPTTLWGKSPCEVSESVIRRLQNTSSWTDSEAECRDSVCVGVLRNSTQEQSLSIADRARLTVLKLRFPALSAVLLNFRWHGKFLTNRARVRDDSAVRGVSARSHLMGSQLG